MKRLAPIAFRWWIFLVLASLAWPAGLAQAQDGEPVSPDPLAPTAPLALVDNFGYTYEILSGSLKIEGVDADIVHDPYWPVNNRVPVPFTSNLYLSDVINFAILDTVDPVYEIRYYEQVLHGLQVSVNGLIRFIPSFDEDRFNFPLPTGDKSPVAPTGFIAPVWGEFARSADFGFETQIWYRFYNQVGVQTLYKGRQALVIEWENLRHVATGQLVSFGVALLDTGDIYVLLKKLPISPQNQDFTIGINNSDGEDGLTYYHDHILADGAVLGDMKVVWFKVPPLDWRVKASPYLQGGFTQDGIASFSFEVFNITDLDGSNPDSYNLSYTKDSPGAWQVQFFNSNWQSEITNTGIIAQGGSKTINLRVTAPPGAQPGASVKITVFIASPTHLGASNKIQVQVSVPVAFLEAYQDASGAYENLIWSVNQATSYIFNDATNNNLAVGDYTNGYVMVSERPPVSGKSSIGYAFIDILGILRKGSSISNGGNDDRFPAVSVHNTTGLSGLTWVRNKTIMFTVLDPALLGIKFTPKAIATAVYSAGYPAVAALPDGTFLVAWSHGSGVNNYKLRLAHLDANGGIVNGVIAETGTYENVQGVSLLPAPASWTPNVAFLAFVGQSSGTTALYTARVNLPGGSPAIGTPTAVSSAKVAPNSPASSLAAVAGNRILLGWVDAVVPFITKSNFPYYDQGIKYALFTSGSTDPQQTGTFNVPNQLQAENLSVGEDKDGNGILVWNDRQNAKYLYYALIGPPAGTPTGSFSTIAPQMIHAVASGGRNYILSSNGQALALYGGRYQVFLPLILK
jgi:hypothetical protein